jgi:hypothetical protein
MNELQPYNGGDTRFPLSPLTKILLVIAVVYWLMPDVVPGPLDDGLLLLLAAAIGGLEVQS